VKSQTFAEPAPAAPAPEPAAPAPVATVDEPVPPPATPLVEAEAPTHPESATVDEPSPWPTYAGFGSGSAFSWQTATAPEPAPEEPAEKPVAETVEEAPVVAESAPSEEHTELTQPIVWSVDETEPEDPIAEQDTLTAESAEAESPAEETAAAPIPLGAPAAAPVASDSESQEGATLSGALALAEELRGVLAELAAAPPVEIAPTGDDLAALRAQLSDALDANSVDGDALEALTGIVSTAKERPRDIDVLLDLTRHLDTILALKSSYEGLRERIGAVSETE
jgi:hypothetical protein